MKALTTSESLNRLNLSAIHLWSQDETRVDWHPIQQDRAGATLTDPTTLFCSGETKLLTKNPEKCPMTGHLHLNPTPIYPKLDHSVHRVFESLSSSKFEVRGSLRLRQNKQLRNFQHRIPFSLSPTSNKSFISFHTSSQSRHPGSLQHHEIRNAIG